jgi:hypothetical protein
LSPARRRTLDPPTLRVRSSDIMMICPQPY